MNRFYALVAVVALSVAASAGTLPLGWTCTGNCGTGGPDGDVPLGPSGNPYAWISTFGGQDGVGALAGVGGVGFPTNGTLLQSSTFTANAGDPLHFYFDYVTSDGDFYVDYAWVQLVNVNDSSLNVLLFTARSTPAGVPGPDMPPPEATLGPFAFTKGAPTWSPLDFWGDGTYCWPGNPDLGCGYTGWVESTYNVVVGGDYYLLFGVTNWEDTLYDSGLAIDRVTIADREVEDVPEPGTLVLLGTGLFALAGAVRRKLIL